MKRISQTHLWLAAVVIAALPLFSCGGDGEYVRLSGYAQGGTYSVTFNPGRLKIDTGEVQAAVDSILESIDKTLSGYNKGSQLSRFNAGEDPTPNAMFKEVYSMSRKFYEETGGALDVAAGPLFDAWGFGFSRDSLPSRELVDSLLGACGMDKLDERMRPLSEGVRPSLNFNAIAQGYSCDLVADYLHSLGVTDMLVDIGEIYSEGLNPKGLGWTIGVDRPVDGNLTPGADLKGIWRGDGSGCGIVTSGNYRKFYVKDGRKYSHTIDPRSGYPVEHPLLSATIVAPDAATADAYATYCMVIGLEESKAFISSRTDIEGYLIYDEDGGMAEWTSAGFNLVD